MKSYFIALFILLFLISCKNTVQTSENSIITKTAICDSIYLKSKKLEQHKILQTVTNFKDVLTSSNGIEHTGSKYADELTNSSSNFVSYIFDLHEKELSVKTTSYTYKKKCIFYLHSIKCTNNCLSIKPFLDNAQGKRTKGYLSERVLIFAMKNDKEANYIDIPEKLNPLKLREELLEILYEKIDCDIILCDRTKKCEYKDLRKK